MSAQEIVPGIYTCNAAAQCFAHASPEGRPEDVAVIMDKFMTNSTKADGNHSRKPAPNEQTFSLLALAYARQRPPSPHKAEQVLADAVEHGLTLSSTAGFNAVLQGYAGLRPASVDDVERLLLKWGEQQQQVEDGGATFPDRARCVPCSIIRACGLLVDCH